MVIARLVFKTTSKFWNRIQSKVIDRRQVDMNSSIFKYLRLEGINGALDELLYRAKKAVTYFAHDGSDVPELTEQTFHNYLKNHGKVFVMFYDPFCPVCRKATVDFEKMYETMRNSLAFGAVDATNNQELAISEGIKAFPTFRLYQCNGNCSHKTHEGRLTVSEMEAFVKFSSLNEIISPISNHAKPRRVHGLACFYALNTPKQCLPAMIVEKQSKFFTTTSIMNTIPKVPRMLKIGKRDMIIPNQVMELTSANFKTKIKSFKGVLVFFYAPWCAHCFDMLQEFVSAAAQIAQTNDVMALCNAEENTEIVDSFYVGKIPTLKYFRKGIYITDYIGDVKTEQLVQFMNDPNMDDEFLRRVTSHRPKGDLFQGEILTPVQKKKLWEGLDGSELIIEITDENISRILKENSSFLLLFYACWNKVCVGLKLDYINLAKAVEKTDVVLGACDCEEHVEVADRFLISRFPTLKYFRDGLPVRDYCGDYQVDSILTFLKDPTKLQIAPETKKPKSEKSANEQVPEYWKGVEGGGSILHFTDFNYKTLLDQNIAILLMFYVPWCKACTPVKREFAQAAQNINKEIGVLAACDAERNNEIADAFYVIKLPTIKYYKRGKFVTDYTGKRTADAFLAFMKDPMKKPELPPTEVSGLNKVEEKEKNK